MKALADYIHSRGMKFGMYSCAGNRTCASFPGSFEHEFEDAKTFAEWEIDLLKYDHCNIPVLANIPILFNRMSMALKATGREILFSACSAGRYEPEKWARASGAHMYRSTGDINDSFASVNKLVMGQVDHFNYSAPGCYNDLDMLVCGMDGVGNVGHPGLCGDTEYKTHFALWCMEGAPLMIGSDVRHIRPETVALLTNPGLLRINSDSECRTPIPNFIRGNLCPTIFKHLSDHEVALGFFNLSDEEATLDFRPYDLGISTTSGFGLKLKEVFTEETYDYVNDYMSLKLQPHDCKVFIGSYVIKN
jgi:alpha-galactosidase